MRDYTRFNEYLDCLMGDIYSQPEDAGHTAWAEDVIDEFIVGLEDCKSILDVGCGTGFCSDKLTALGFTYVGITASAADQGRALHLKRNVRLGDMTYLPYDGKAMDLILARHVLEHSPFPIITLMEWWRVSKKYLLLVTPAPEYWTYAGKNHYSVAEREQLGAWLHRAGWSIIRESMFMTTDKLYQEYNTEWNQNFVKCVEYRLLCEKE